MNPFRQRDRPTPCPASSPRHPRIDPTGGVGLAAGGRGHRRVLGWLALACAALLAAAAAFRHEQAVHAAAQADVPAAVTELLQREDTAVIRGDLTGLATVFATSGAAASASLRRARNRLNYVQSWAAAREVHLVAVTVTVRAGPLHWGAGRRTVSLRATVSEALSYRHGDGPVQRFGLGTRRLLRLIRVEGEWRVDNQEFTDPLDQDTRLPGPASPGFAVYRPAPLPPPPPRPDYNPLGAVHYADTYCGAAPGCGNGNLYNPAYRDYNGSGGDCTNFTSQMLHEGGGLPADHRWFYVDQPAPGEGSLPWLRARSLLPYLLSSGRARILARGDFAQMVTRGPDGHAPVDQLAPGDLIAYVEAGHAVHFGLVIGRDAAGYPLVDSHTADRFHVPWDLGWDQTAQFTFLRLGTEPGN